MSLVTVTGDAEIRVVPDEVILTLGVETWNQDLSEAKKENDKKIRDIFDFVKKLKIEEKHIQNAPGSDGIENSSTALGQIKINANVTVSFELEEK